MQRRTEDGLMGTDSSASVGVEEVRAYHFVARPENSYKLGLEPISTISPDQSDAMVLLERGGESLVVAGEIHRILSEGRNVQDIAIDTALEWKMQHVRMLRRLEMPEHLLAFTHQLSIATFSSDVYQALEDYAIPIVGGFTSRMFIETDGQFVSGSDSFGDLGIDGIRIVYRDDAPDEFALVMDSFSASSALCVAVGPDAVLCVFERRRSRLFDIEDQRLIAAIASQASVSIEKLSLFREVSELSLIDPLTGLGNRRLLGIVLDQEMRHARRGSSLSVVLLDVDGLSRINDSQGREAGDEVLAEIARALGATVRDSDTVIRYGSDEFLVILPGAKALESQVLVSRLRDRLGNVFSLSVGIAEYDLWMETGCDLVEIADRNLRLLREGRRLGTD
jgi:diguanylate cyclase (GGDEF)-like protein